MKIEKKIGLIGVGNMGAAILEGLISKKIASPDQVWIYDKILDKPLEFASKWKVHVARSNSEVVQQTEVIVFAVKPQDLLATAAEIKSHLRPSQIFISILAGTPIQKLKNAFDSKPRFIRAMPNLGAKVGESLTALTGEASALKIADDIFSACGITIHLQDEKYFDLITALSGSGPAYFFYLMELMAKEAVSHGLDAKQARTLAIQTALGAALLAKSADEHPEELRKKVTSKGGTTEAALNVFADKKFHEIFSEAIEAALRRGQELSRG